MTQPSQWESIQRFLGQEALALDTRDWDVWLELYLPSCEYWIPAWRSDGKLVTDPHTELSLIYYPNRVGLESRVFRVRTGRASSAAPSVRTSHINQLVAVDAEGSADAGAVLVRSHWSVHSVLENRVAHYFGYAHYRLVAHGDSWRIASKKTVILNDMIHEVVDFYNV